MIVLVAAIPVLATIGYRTLRDTTAGRRIDAQNDPKKPRYEANVVPTPVALVAETDTDGKLQGLTMLSLGNKDGGGSVVFIPITTVVPRADGTLDTLANIAMSDPAGLEQAAANLMGLSFDQLIGIATPQWQQFVAPVGSLMVDNPDRVLTPGLFARVLAVFTLRKAKAQAAGSR